MFIVAEESDSASMSTATPTRKVLTPVTLQINLFFMTFNFGMIYVQKSSPAQKVSDTTVYANDGSTGVGDVSAEEVKKKINQSINQSMLF